MSDNYDSHVTARAEVLREHLSRIEAQLAEVKANLLPSKPRWLEEHEATQDDLAQFDGLWDDLIDTRRKFALLYKAVDEVLNMPVGCTSSIYLAKKKLLTALGEIEE